MSAEAIIVYVNIPGIEDIDPTIFRNPQFAQKMDFDVFRRIFLKAKKVNKLYEFSINGITYRAKLIRDMEKWEKAYYANSNETCIAELMQVYP